LGKSVLLHICCGPDATWPAKLLLDEGFEVVGYFFGSNVQPREEYLRRREAVSRVAESFGLDLVEDEYMPELWLERVRGLEGEPEGGRRCRLCFYLQLRRAAQVCRRVGASSFTTTLTVSPHKDVRLISELGGRISSLVGVEYMDVVFRRGDGFKRSVAMSRELGLYRQNYCGCVFSRR